MYGTMSLTQIVTRLFVARKATISNILLESLFSYTH